MRFATIILLAALWPLPALALDVSATKAGEEFERAATAFGAKEMKATEESCAPGEESYTCRFSVTGGVTLMAMASYDTDRVTGLGLYFTSESEPLYFFVAVGALLGMLDNDITQGERKRIAQKLINGATRGGAAEIGDDYTITSDYDQSIGVRILADVH